MGRLFPAFGLRAGGVRRRTSKINDRQSALPFSIVLPMIMQTTEPGLQSLRLNLCELDWFFSCCSKRRVARVSGNLFSA